MFRSHASSCSYGPFSIAALGVLVAACGSEVDSIRLEPLDYDGRRLTAEWHNSDATAASLRLYIDGENGEELLWQSQIDNGGEALTWDNLRPVTDRPPELILCVNGSGQPDRALRIDTNTRIVVQMERTCTN